MVSFAEDFRFYKNNPNGWFRWLEKCFDFTLMISILKLFICLYSQFNHNGSVYNCFKILISSCQIINYRNLLNPTTSVSMFIQSRIRLETNYKILTSEVFLDAAWVLITPFAWTNILFIWILLIQLSRYKELFREFMKETEALKTIETQRNIEKYTRIVIVAQELQGKQCNICMGDYIENEHVRILNCSHDYHVNCIDTWLIINPTCPMCRTSLVAN
jgi:hypothetical protein